MPPTLAAPIRHARNFATVRATEGLEARDSAAALELDRRYADLDVGLADLSIAVLAGKLWTRCILTFDERHFRAVRPLQGGTFTLLPVDPR